jgi:hypothetical protein
LRSSKRVCTNRRLECTLDRGSALDAFVALQSGALRDNNDVHASVCLLLATLAASDVAIARSIAATPDALCALVALLTGNLRGALIVQINVVG